MATMAQKDAPADQPVEPEQPTGPVRNEAAEAELKRREDAEKAASQEK